MAELLPALLNLGGGGFFIGVIVYLLANNRADRAAASERINAANQRADEAENRARQARANEDTERLRANNAEAALSRIALQATIPAIDPTAPPIIAPAALPPAE